MEDTLYILTVVVDVGIMKLVILRLKHILHSPFEKGVIERAKEYVKDRTEDFGDYYPRRKSMIDCNLIHVYQWMMLFIFFIFLYNSSKSRSKQNILNS